MVKLNIRDLADCAPEKVQRSVRTGRARLYVELLTRQIIDARGRGRVRVDGVADGPAPALGSGRFDVMAGPRDQALIAAASAGHYPGGVVRGAQGRVVRRHVPRVLRAYDDCDPCRAVAGFYGLVAERIGAVPGQSVEGLKCDGGKGSTDGGVVGRVAQARALSIMRDAIGNGIALRPGHRSLKSSKPVATLALIDAVLIDGLDLKAVLRSHGTSLHNRQIGALAAALDNALRRMVMALDAAGIDWRGCKIRG